MSTISFSDSVGDILGLSTRTLELILDRAVPHVSDPEEAEDLRTCIYSDGVSFDVFERAEGIRLADAFRRGALELKVELEAGKEPLPKFGAGNIPKLDEIVALIDRFLPADY
ncbi:MAG: hypothetical protein J2P25_12785 [Nocardiopsaceae bacterium]|nr:hypothetical protein [Nocardiopsaceae bacterium]